ncbi:MAG: 2-iminoacetate synthase ThiH [Candidatus Goldbacteria bacterium]|nr:2-iminoacetate synthase ThiH [Candidatus Goldiibacteriota bacterium]
MIREIIKEEKNFYDNFKREETGDVSDIFQKDVVSKSDFLRLLTSKDENVLELMAEKAKRITDNYFGKMILLYVPLYISNYCINKCVYCGFSALNDDIPRKKLKKEEIETEMAALKENGFDTILILTGEDRNVSPVDYIAEAVKTARKHFSEILVEVYAMTADEYKRLVDNGLTGMTIYQETYDEKLYDKLHLSGPKKDFVFRLEAPERAIKAGVKEINVGCLLGLNGDFLMDAYLTSIHADYLQGKYPDVEVSVSYPRIQPAEASIKIDTIVDDVDFVRIITATRIFLSRVGLNVSTRERPYMRDNLIGLGITKMSAGSKTSVGGYSLAAKDPGQFEINDKREVREITDLIISKGYRPEFTNWVRI